MIQILQQCTFVCGFVFYKELCICLLICLHKEATVARGTLRGSRLRAPHRGLGAVRAPARKKLRSAQRDHKYGGTLMLPVANAPRTEFNCSSMWSSNS